MKKLLKRYQLKTPLSDQGFPENLSITNLRTLMKISTYLNRIRADVSWSVGIALLAIISLSSNFYKISSDQKSEYYAAVVKSMSLGVKNFIYGAMDPAGFISVDKIPGSFWVPALLVHIFGFSQWTLIAPNAIAGCIAAVVVAVTIKKYFGDGAGLIAGFAVATCPILIAVARSNQPEPVLIALLAIVANRFLKALETQSRRSLIICGLWAALAFQSYMIITWLIWPAIAFAWLYTKKSLKTKILDVFISGLVSLVFSLSWIFLVLITPKNSRPYVGGSLHNNPFEMVFGYNGLGRFESANQTSDLSGFGFKVFTPSFGGHPGIFRLFNFQLLGQIGWLIPAAAASIVLLFAYKKATPIIVFYTTWFITLIIIFSAAKGIHQFYTSALILSIAPLFAIAIKEFSTSKEVLVILITIPILTAMLISFRYRPYALILPIIQFLFTLVIVYAIYSKHLRRQNFLIALFLVPSLVFTQAVWGFGSRSFMSGLNPIAGPSEFGQVVAGRSTLLHKRLVDSGIASLKESTRNQIRLVRYLEEADKNSKYLFAISTGMKASPYINLTNRYILPIGGFEGQDPSPSLSQFVSIVQSKELKYFVSADGKFNPDLRTARKMNLSSIEIWVLNHCSLDSKASFREAIYDCSPSGT